MPEMELDQELESKRFISRTQLERVTSLSWTSLRKIMDFPKPRVVGKSFRWCLAEVIDYMANQPEAKPLKQEPATIAG